MGEAISTIIQAPQPVVAKVIELKFRQLPNHTLIDNPTLLAAVPVENRDPDRAMKPLCGHGIVIQRHESELDYILKDGSRHRVPSPSAIFRDLRAQFESVSWAEEPRFQSAFTIKYPKNNAHVGVFRVNIHGEGRLDVDILGWDPDVRPESLLRIRPSGLTYESDLPIAAGSAGLPRSPRIGKARRYHYSGSRLSLYVARTGERTAAVLIDDVTSKPVKTWEPVLDLAIYDDGTAFITYLDLDDKGQTREQMDEIHINDKQLDPNTTLKRLGDPPLGESRLQNLKLIQALGVKVNERGARFSGFELKVALDLMKRSFYRTGLVRAIQKEQEDEQRRMRKVDSSSKDLPIRGPGLTLVKDLLEVGGSYDDEKGQVIIPGWIRGTIEETPTAIRHELAHALFHAAGGIVHGLPRQDIPAEIRQDVQNWMAFAYSAAVPVGPVDFPLSPPTSTTSPDADRWRHKISRMMSNDHILNQAFMELHYRFSIDDPEQTGDIRGLDVADESRYMMPTARGDELGHGFDNVNEFVASFVVSTTQYQDSMVNTVRQSLEKDGSRLGRLYATVWDRVNKTILDLPGSNPYNTLTKA